VTTVLWLALALVAGVGLGLFYFGGLWLTVRRIPASRHPVLLTLGSFVGRTVAVVLGFYLVMGGHWERLLASMAGLIVARILLVRRLGSSRPGAGSASDSVQRSL